MSSSARSNANTSIVKDTLKNCDELLETAAEKVKANVEGIDADTIKAWKEKILSLSKLSATTRLTNEKSGEVLQSVLGEKRNSESAENVSDDTLRKQIKQKLQDKLKGVDLMKEPLTKRIHDLLGQKPASSSDADFEVVEEGFKKSDTICPYTSQKFVQAMKSSNCIHHIDKIAYESLIKNKNNFKCVVAGCSATWTTKTTSFDEDFQSKVARFARKEASQGGSRRDHEATELYDEEEDNEYTQV